MPKQKTPSESDPPPRTPEPDDSGTHESPFAKLTTPTRRRRPRKQAEPSTRLESPAESTRSVDIDAPPQPTPDADAAAPTQPVATQAQAPDTKPAPAETKPAAPPEEATAPLGPRTYRLSNPQAQTYLDYLNRAYAATDMAAVHEVIRLTALQPADADTTDQAKGLRQLINQLSGKRSVEEVRSVIDSAMAPLDETGRAVEAARMQREAADHERERSQEVRPATPPPEPLQPKAPPPEVSPAAAPPPPSSRLTTAAGPSGVDGVPAAYNDGVEWLRNGLRRHQAGVWIGLIAGWTGIWIALWGAALGLLFGALAAAGLASSLGTIGISQAASAVGIPVGAFLGAVGGFAAVTRFLIIDHPIQAVISVASGAVLAVLVVVGGAAFERLSLRLRGYRRLSRAEVRRVAPLVKDAADAMSLTALPRFAMDDRLIPNAWTHMRTIVLTKGLLQSMDDAEVRATLAHELEHWRSGDAVGLHFVWAAAWPVALIYNLGMLMAGRTQQGNQPRRGAFLGLLALIGWTIAWPAWVIIKFLITPVVASSQRSYEYRADAAAARIGYAASLSSALRTMTAFESGRTGWEQAMAATHPPTELRLEALEPPKPDDDEYQEEDLRAPSGHELRRLLTFWKRPAR